MKKLNIPSRIILTVASLSLIAVFFVPTWRIDLAAPQYPEGLSMFIWMDKLTGEIQIINGLNHYIGMKHINAAMFPEFSYLPYILGAFIAFGLITALTGNRKLLVSFIFLTILAGISALVDFYKWGYDYGHNLDPNAAIQIPGFSYQPPVIGHKQLLNFDAYSYPSLGGWIVVIVALAFITVFIVSGRQQKRKSTGKVVTTLHRAAAIASVLIVLLTSCSVKPEPFNYGKDACSFCKMNIVSPLFGGEVVTKKGKVYKFDDLHCMVSFLKSGEVKENNIAQTLVIDYKNQNRFINVQEAVLVESPELHSPMNGNAAAFADKTAAQPTIASINGIVTNWNELFNHMN